MAAHGDAEAREQPKRDADVGLGDERTVHLYGDALLRGRQRQRHEQGSEELAGHVATHANGGIQPQRGLPDVQRRKAGRAQIVHAAAEAAERINQVSDGALVHAGYAAQCVVAAQHGERRRERAHGGAGVAEEEVGFGRAPRAASAAQPVDDDGGCGALFHAAAELTQRVQHDARIVACQQAAQRGAPFGEGGEQQGAVGQALGAGKTQRARYCTECGQVKKR